MDIREFFSSVLPSQGIYCLAQPIKGKRSFHQDFFSTQEETAVAALAIDGAGKTVYHACASFITPENRQQVNAAFMRSFWVDADVEPGNANKYQTLQEAITDVGRVCKALCLPLPLMVKSGAGLHAYWILSDDIDAQQWSTTAVLFKAALKVLGFKQDNTRTADASSVLRPVGTVWRKRGVRPVVAIHGGSPLSYEDFATRLGGLPHQVPATDAFANTSNDDLGTPPEYPPSKAVNIITHCPTLAHVAASAGNVTEPLWRAMLGVVKYTVEGDAQCHEWSAGHPDYDQTETQNKIDSWVKPPTTCEHFRATNENQCTGCTQKVSSPIHLGYFVEEPAAAAAAAYVPEQLTLVKDSAASGPQLPAGFLWDGKHLRYGVQDKKTGVLKWMAFASTLFYPINRLRNEDGDWDMLVRHEKHPGEFEDFLVPTQFINSPHELAKALGAKEIALNPIQGAQYTQKLMAAHLSGLISLRAEQHTYGTMGWAKNYREFILGNQRISANDIDTILPGERICDAGWNHKLGRAGTRESAIALVDDIYNRKGGEAYQFVIAAMLASPLIELTEIDNWHGIPIALVGPTGIGKTTVCKVGASFFGHCTNFLVHAGDQGTTLQSMITRAATAKNLPLIYDEITKRGFQEVIDLAYSMSTGKPKDRNSREGRIINAGLFWNLIAILTSNVSVCDMIALHDNAQTVEATQVRVFEIMFDENYAKNIWSDINAREIIETRVLAEQFGILGNEWLQYIIKNAPQLKDDIRKTRNRLNPNTAEETKERYYYDLLATTLVALVHLNGMGIVKFAPAPIVRWFKNNVQALRSRRGNLVITPDGYIAAFIGSLTRRTISTRFFADGRLADKKEAVEIPHETPAARQARDDRVFVVTARSMSDWCKDRKLSPNYLQEQLGRRGYIISRPDKHGVAQRAWQGRLTKGTNIPSTNECLIELDYDMVCGAAGVAPSNVVNLVPSA